MRAFVRRRARARCALGTGCAVSTVAQLADVRGTKLKTAEECGCLLCVSGRNRERVSGFNVRVVLSFGRKVREAGFPISSAPAVTIRALSWQRWDSFEVAVCG